MLEIPMLLVFVFLSFVSAMGVLMLLHTVLDYFEFRYAADIALKLCGVCIFVVAVALTVLLIAISYTIFKGLIQ